MKKQLTPEIKYCVRYLKERGFTEKDFANICKALSPTDADYSLVKLRGNAFFDELAEKLRNLWPSGGRVIKGKTYEWRDSPKNISARLEVLWRERLAGKTYTIEECLAVARRYLAQFEHDTKFMMSVQYFVWKQKELIQSNGKIKYVTESKFADMLEGKEAEDAIMNEWNEVLNSADIGEGELI
jgi:hypothetical protein